MCSNSLSKPRLFLSSFPTVCNLRLPGGTNGHLRVFRLDCWKAVLHTTFALSYAKHKSGPAVPLALLQADMLLFVGTAPHLMMSQHLERGKRAFAQRLAPCLLQNLSHCESSPCDVCFPTARALLRKPSINRFCFPVGMLRRYSDCCINSAALCTS